MQVQRGPVHSFLAELYHWGGSKTLEKKCYMKRQDGQNLQQDFLCQMRSEKSRKIPVHPGGAQMQQRDLKGTQGWNGLDSTCVDHQLKTTGQCISLGPMTLTLTLVSQTLRAN